MDDKQPRGRPRKPDEEKVKLRTVRLTDKHYRIYKRLGRDRWLREMLDKEGE